MRIFVMKNNKQVMLVERAMKVNKVQKSRVNEIDWENLVFGNEFTDHMLVMDYENGAWKTPEIMPFGNLMMHPATSVFHYGQALFEGLKAYRHENGDVIVFRPDMNATRFKESCIRMCMPEIPEEDFVQMVLDFVSIEKEWVSNKAGYSLYLRPFMIATEAHVGVKASESYKFILFACPVGAYYKEPVNIKIEEHYTRAAQGGIGRTKAAANYGASLYPATMAKKEGFHQLLWTDAISHEYVEEAGTMNVMFVKDGALITPTEEQDTILRGVTKRSVIQIAQHWGIKVEERKISVKEIIEGIEKSTLTDAFGAGTAATIAPIAKIAFQDKMYDLPAIEKRDLSNKISKFIGDVKTGKTEDIFNWNFKVD